VYGAKQQGAALDLSWNQSLLQYDYWVVMKGSKNYDNAMKFLAYFAQPKPQAVFATEITYGPINKDAYNFIDPELAKWLPGSPTNIDKQLFQDYSWWNTEDAAGQSNWTKAIDRCTKLLSQ
jgi:putative spermidine/putrescine transport system substrate-binding protein